MRKASPRQRYLRRCERGAKTGGRLPRGRAPSLGLPASASTLATVPAAVAFANLTAFVLELAGATQTSAVAPALRLLDETSLRRSWSWSADRSRRTRDRRNAYTGSHQNSQDDGPHGSSGICIAGSTSV